MPPPKQRRPKLKEQLKQVHADHKLLLAKLKYILSAHRQLMSFNYIKPFDVVSAIKQCVEMLTHLAELMYHKDLLKAKFCEIFQAHMAC